MKMLKIFLLQAIVFVSLNAETVIQEIFSFKQAQNSFETADNTTLILFDLDETLCFWLDKINRNKNLIFELKKRAPDKFTYFFSIWLSQSKKALIEPFIADIIKELQNRGVKTLGFTARKAHHFGVVPSMQEHCYNELLNMGISFEDSCSKNMTFDTCSTSFENYPVLYKGIIVTNHTQKGEVLKAYLDTLDTLPKKIIFFDDLEENLVSVKHELATHEIPLELYLYSAHKLNSEQPDISLATYQLNYLYEHKEWLSDEEAVKKLLEVTQRQ